MLNRAARLGPMGVSVMFLADRCCGDPQLRRYLRDETLQWHFRIRVKSNAWIQRPHKGWKWINQYHLAAGNSILLPGITLTKTRPLPSRNLALGRDPISAQLWLVVTDEPASRQTFLEYGARFQIEAELLDEKSNCFQLERSYLRSVPAHERLCFVLAVTTLLLTVQGQQVVAAGKRRWVDAHWHRCNSYFRIGWNWFKGCWHQDWQLFSPILLPGGTAPDPAIADKNKTQQQFEREFTLKSYQFAA